MNHEKIYRSLYRIRRAEEEVARIYPTDKIKSPVHLSIGQEAVSVGVCEALQPKDVVFGTYRSHALFLAKGGGVKEFMAELYGKATGCARGKGGSMHLIDIAHNMLGTSAVVGTTIPQAVGYAYAMKYRRSDAIVVSFMGDGAVEEGVFHESLNFAALKRLPIIFVCENNCYAIHTHQRQRQHWAEICDVVCGHGLPAERIEDNDVLHIHERISETATAIRSGQSGPAFFECMTYRWKEHVGPNDDFLLGYRTEAEAQPWKEKDAVRIVGRLLPSERRVQIEQEVEAEIQEALRFADASPFPDATELYTDTFKESVPIVVSSTRSGPGTSSAAPPGRTLSFVEALREATDQEMARDPSVLVFGLDVDDPKAILGTTRGLPQKYGPERVFGTPLSEDAMTGAAIGMALAGLRPVHVHIRMDFLLLAMNQLINIAAKSRYMYGGQVSVPLVVRSMIGRSWGQGAQHSQALHAFFMHVPGLKVVAPTTPYDAKGCLIAAIRDDNPILFIEHRLVHSQKGPVPEESYVVAPGKARITAHGNDVTLVGISYMQIECLRAQRYLETVGIHAEVIDPIWLSPLDLETIVESVRKTRRLVVVDNGWTTCGASAEIAACVAVRFEGQADIRIRRMGFAPVTCPTTPSLEAHFYPNPRSIASAAYNLVRSDQTDWLPEERADLIAVEFKGPF
jgi:pyruvate/2-oxoglutarate/acetoin dehydrogenase E1 component/TPP-dependent pyruvate/acetoin dehydrogenase alpha subunit